MSKKQDYANEAKEIIRLIGGKENVSKLTHCITRLRFQLKDRSIVDEEAIKKLEIVTQVIETSTQYQLVIGPKVGSVYDAVMLEMDLKEEASVSEKEEKPKGIMGFFETLSACFIPMLPVLIAGCVTKGILSLCVALGLSESAGIYIILSGFGDSVLMFIPVLVGYGAAKRFGIDAIYGVGLGIFFCMPSLQADVLATGDPIGTILGVDYYHTIFGIPFIGMNYQYTVIPIIAIVWFASKLVKWLNKKIPDVLKFNLVPLISICVAGVLGFIIIGPVFQMITDVLVDALSALINFSPMVFGAVLGATYLLMVMFGVHYCLDPFCYTYLLKYGYDPTWPATDPGTWILLGILVAIIIRTKDQKLRKVSIGAAIPMFISGTTEPGLYGVVVPNMKKILPILMPLAAIAGAVFISLVPGAYVIGGEGLFGFLNYTSKDSWFAVIVYFVICGVGFLAGLLITSIVWRDKGKERIKKSDK